MLSEERTRGQREKKGGRMQEKEWGKRKRGLTSFRAVRIFTSKSVGSILSLYSKRWIHQYVSSSPTSHHHHHPHFICFHFYDIVCSHSHCSCWFQNGIVTTTWCKDNQRRETTDSFSLTTRKSPVGRKRCHGRKELRHPTLTICITQLMMCLTTVTLTAGEYILMSIFVVE